MASISTATTALSPTTHFRLVSLIGIEPIPPSFR
jgi:hypothetical protein